VAAQRKENSGRSRERDNDSMPRVLFQNQIERMRHAQQLSNIGASTQAAFATAKIDKSRFPFGDAVLNSSFAREQQTEAARDRP
jgi:hypothetical protein